MPKVSVIVPVYKTEAYLERCVNSLISQTLEDIEIILVDDGSPDNCPKMCDEFARKDSRIKVVHKKNGGLSSARNAGIMAANGEYLAYVDSDDFVCVDAYEKMYNCAIKNNVDFVMADYYRICDGEKNKSTLDIKSGYYNKENIKKEIYPMLIMRDCIDYGPLLSVWHCLYKTSFIKDNDLMFDEEILWSEDCIYSAILGYKANSFYYLKDEFVYNYIKTDNSITTSFKPNAWDIYCLMNKKLRAFFEDKKDFDFSNQLNLHTIYFACSALNELKYTNLSLERRYNARKKIICSDDFIKAIKQARFNVGFKFKIILWLMKYKQVMILTLLERR